MVNKDDWRLCGQEQELMGARLVKKEYRMPSEKWDHDHCVFCWDKFSEQQEDLHEGYCVAGKNRWICKQCFDDFKDMFRWTVEE